MASRTRDFTGDIMAGLSGIGQIGTAITDRRKADLLAKEGAARIKESEQIQKMNQQKLDQASAVDRLNAETETRGALAPAAMEGTKTATGRAVDFQAVKSANQADSDAKLYNIVNKGRDGFMPMSGGAFRKMAEAKALEANTADQETIRTEERATEAHVSKMANDKAAREAGRYTPVVLDGGRLGAMNTKEGSIKVTGEKTQPKASEKNAEFNALPVEAQEQVKVISKNMGFQKTLRGSIASDLEQFKAAKTPSEALTYGLGMLKAMNSTLGPDALSNDEADRMGSELKMQVGNWRGPGKFIGTDLSAFVNKVQSKIGSLDGSIKQSQTDLDSLYGRKPAATPAAPAAASGHPQDSEAVTWAKANPKDPRSVAILKANGL